MDNESPIPAADLVNWTCELSVEQRCFLSLHDIIHEDKEKLVEPALPKGTNLNLAG